MNKEEEELCKLFLSAKEEKESGKQTKQEENRHLGIISMLMTKSFPKYMDGKGSQIAKI